MSVRYWIEARPEGHTLNQRLILGVEDSTLVWAEFQFHNWGQVLMLPNRETALAILGAMRHLMPEGTPFTLRSREEVD